MVNIPAFQDIHNFSDKTGFNLSLPTPHPPPSFLGGFGIRSFWKSDPLNSDLKMQKEISAYI